ncbi:3-hydroxyacyl-ACP dehydratase [Clostridiaceae bacterium JG1575]|nr:3-hydroxyacyl-ACP dehydratase [Clostridiaceae bacterium JG1575]
MADYQKMWQDLNMDVEAHDQLCEVLPMAFGDIYLSQENRPQGMDYFNLVVSEIHGLRPSELIEHQKKGGKVVGSFCIHVPDEVPMSAGAIATGLCSGSQFWVPGGEKVLPTATCPLIKASIGARLDRTCPFFRIADLFVGETTCDGKKKAWEILKDDAPMHIMDIPQMKRERDYAHWKEEILDYMKLMEELTSHKITKESMEKAIAIANEKRKALARLHGMRRHERLPISGKDVLLATQIAFYDDPQRFAQMTHALCDELDQRVQEGVSVFPAGTKRILLSGTPLSIPNWKIHHLIETSGGAVVGEEMCTGSRYFEGLVEEGANTLDEQVDHLVERYLGGIHCACFTPNTERIDDIVRLARDYQADGVIDLSLKFCTIYDSEGYSVEKALREQGIPVLGLETDYTDEDAGQLRTRIEAFLEMI